LEIPIERHWIPERIHTKRALKALNLIFQSPKTFLKEAVGTRLEKAVDPFGGCFCQMIRSRKINDDWASRSKDGISADEEFSAKTFQVFFCGNQLIENFPLAGVETEEKGRSWDGIVV
jgi:hypothetical protein